LYKKILAIALGMALLVSTVLAGCQATGVPQSQYDQVSGQLADVQAKLNQAQDQISRLQAEKDATASQFAEAQSTIAALQAQMGEVQNENSLVGATPAETAEKIVKYYHETHVYSTYDLFVCSDMAAEVWNMLKAQGISSVIAVGDIDNTVTDIVLCTHAWVLAEVAPGQYLALETTGGFTVPASQNALYYRGWTFASPAALKSYNQDIREYNVRVGIHNEMAAADRDIVAQYNKSTSQAEADKLEAVHNELVKLIGQQEAELNSLMAEINSLAAPLISS
jgi:outer membrane murein-binding lipoprotein Lpp